MLTLSPLMDTLVAGGEGGGAAQGRPRIDDWLGAVSIPHLLQLCLCFRSSTLRVFLCLVQEFDSPCTGVWLSMFFLQEFDSPCSSYRSLTLHVLVTGVWLSMYFKQEFDSPCFLAGVWLSMSLYRSLTLHVLSTGVWLSMFSVFEHFF